MSTMPMDLALSVIPTDPHWRPTEEAAQRALALLKELFPYAAHHEAKQFEAAHFINPELFASKAYCSTCNTATERYGEPGEAQRLWFANIDRVTLDAPVETLRTVLPACGHEVPFTALTFEWAAGCARFALVATYTYWDDEVMHEGNPLEEPLQALGAALCTPVKVVRTYYTLLPADRRRFEDLMSADEATRVAAAEALDALEAGHFEDHAISAPFPEDNVERLLAAFHATHDHGVKRWIFHAFTDIKTHTPGVVAAVTAHLVPDSPLLESAFYLVHRDHQRYAHLTPTLIALKSHANRDVRWRCAMALAHWPLETPGVLDAVHDLMLDTNELTRLYAVGALYNRRAQRTLDEASKPVLEQMIAMGGTTAAVGHARRLLEGENTPPVAQKAAPAKAVLSTAMPKKT